MSNLIINGPYCVYAHINRINGKMYVGQTLHNDNPNLRWANGNGYKRHPYFWNAITKYGWDNFDHEIIASNLTMNEANNFEKLLIDKLDLLNPDNGYNLRDGGNNSELTENHKAKISESMKGKNKGSHNYLSRAVICLNTNEVFDTAIKAGETYGINSSSIGQVCMDKLLSAGKHPKTGERLRWAYYEEYLQKSCRKHKRKI